MGTLICAAPVLYAMSDEKYLETDDACGLDGNTDSSMLAPRLYVKSDASETPNICPPDAELAKNKEPSTIGRNKNFPI